VFDKNRYITSGANATIPSEAITAMWIAIELMPDPKDYLQIFNLKPLTECIQHISHTQEQPKYSVNMYIPLLLPNSQPVTEKVYVIDDGDHSTMLLAEEY